MVEKIERMELDSDSKDKVSFYRAIHQIMVMLLVMWVICQHLDYVCRNLWRSRISTVLS